MLALSAEPDVLLVEGSGATVPPIHAHRTVCVTNAARAATDALSFLGPYRLLRSNLVVLIGADARALGGAACARARPVGVGLRRRDRRLHARAGARRRRCATAPARPSSPPPHRSSSSGTRSCSNGHGIDVRVFSSSLSRRGELVHDLERAARERCDVFLTELKAAAIEVVASEAERSGAEVVFVRNRPVSLPGEPDLDAELLRIHDEAVAESARRETAAAGGR